MHAVLIVILFFCFLGLRTSSAQGQSTTLEPSYPQEEEYVPKGAKDKGFEVTYDARDDFYDLQEQNWKTAAKAEKKLLRKKQIDYSKPPYFGHKKPVKIRPMGKRKYCKVCGIVH